MWVRGVRSKPCVFPLFVACGLDPSRFGGWCEARVSSLGEVAQRFLISPAIVSMCVFFGWRRFSLI